MSVEIRPTQEFKGINFLGKNDRPNDDQDVIDKIDLLNEDSD